MRPLLLLLTFSIGLHAAPPVTTLANFPNSMVYGVQTDSVGNLYVAGFQGTFVKANPFVAKLSPTGQTPYSTTFTGSNFGIAWAIAVDSAGAAYVFGNTNSTDFPVTPGALQTTMQGSFQGFVAKLDPAGKIVYSTFIGGATSVTPGITSAPGLDSILVDSAGDVIITGQAGTNASLPAFPPAPAPTISSSEYFVLKLDPTGAKILAAIRGIGGMIAMDSQSNIYVTGLQYSTETTPISVTPNAFQNEPANSCGLLGAFFSCGYQYVAKLNPALNQVLYATYVTGKYGASPTAISVDASGNAFIAGTTNSPDYPTTPNAYEPQYIAAASTGNNCFFTPHCFTLPPASGYLTEVNPTGTGLVYSTYFSGAQSDSINFAAFTSNAIYLGGTAGSADLPGFAGYPQQCLPGTFETRLSADATEIGSTRIAPPGKLLAFDPFAGTLIASNGTNLIALDPNAPQTPVACILDSADLKPVTSIAPGELLSLFGEFATVASSAPPAGQFPTSLNGVEVDLNGIPGPLLYVGGKQINFQVPPEIAGTPNANITVTSAQSNLSDSRSLSVVSSNPSAFLNTTPPSSALATCTAQSAASVNGALPLAFNADGSANTCLNPAVAGSVVSLFLDGLGLTSAPAISATGSLKVASVTSLAGVPVSAIWQVTLQIPPGQAAGGVQVSLTSDGVPLRDVNLVVWVK